MNASRWKLAGVKCIDEYIPFTAVVCFADSVHKDPEQGDGPGAELGWRAVLVVQMIADHHPRFVVRN